MHTKAAPPKPSRRWYQFTLRTLLIVVTLVGCGFAWFGLKVRESHRQEAAVAAIERLGGRVFYDAEPPGSGLVRALLGDEFFRNVRQVDLEIYAVDDADLEHLHGLTRLTRLEIDGTQITDAGLVHLKALTRLEFLDLNNTSISDAGLKQLHELTRLEILELNNTPVTDAGMAQLAGLSELKLLTLHGTHVTDAGAAALHQAVPNCQINR